jgi:hypothetical protein
MAVDINVLFAGDEYKTTLSMMKILKRDFPAKYEGLINQPERLQEWKDRIDSGDREDDQTRDDIAKYVIGEELLMSTYGIDAAEAQKVMLGGNEGGTNFGELTRGGTVEERGELEVIKGTEPDPVDPPFVGTETEGDEVGLTILTGDEMKWFRDRGTGKWYVEYGLPNSNKTVVFEADPDQLDMLFGEGFRPKDFQETSFSALVGREAVTFAGNISQMEGTGKFEDEVSRVASLALDAGELPAWAAEDGVVMDLLYIANSEEKSEEWLVNQIAKTKGFKERFPGLTKFQEENNLDLQDAITGFLEYETGIKSSLKSLGLDASVTPAMVGDLMSAGHSLTTVNMTVEGYRRMEQFAPAMASFNQVLAQQGFDPLEDTQDLLDFVTGKSSAELYDIYEASSIQEAATAAGLGAVFSVDDAVSAASSGTFDLESATAGMRKAAELLLRLRNEVDVGKYGLNHEELIDISLGTIPRSGRPESEIMESVNRAVLSAQGSLQKKAKPFQSFSQTGTPQAASLREARRET